MSAPCIDVLLADSAVAPPDVSAVITMVGEHDISTVDSLTREFVGVMGDDRGSVVVDLSGVTFMDISIVNYLLRTELHLRRQSRELLLRAPSPNVRRLLELCEDISPLGFRVLADGRQGEPGAV